LDAWIALCWDKAAGHTAWGDARGFGVGVGSGGGHERNGKEGGRGGIRFVDKFMGAVK